MPHAQAVNDSKHTEQVKVMLTERELLDVARVAAIEDRSPAEFIRLTLRVALYGKVSRLATHPDSESRAL